MKSIREQVLEMLGKNDGQMFIMDMRAEFGTTRSSSAGLTSALIVMADKGEVAVTGGGHGKKMVSLVVNPDLSAYGLPTGTLRRVTFPDDWKPDTGAYQSGSSGAVQSSMGHLIMMCGE